MEKKYLRTESQVLKNRYYLIQATVIELRSFT